MGSGHSHGPAVAPGHAGARQRRRLTFSFVLIATFFVVELVAGLWSGSLALLSDAGHMAADVSTLGAALLATHLASKSDESGRRSYGRYRIEVFAALFAAAVMMGVAVFVLIEAVDRIGKPVEIATWPMMIVGLIGLVINVIVLVILRDGASESLNVKGAYLEVLADAAGSVGVLVAGGLMMWTGQAYWDTIVAAAIGIFVAVRAVILGREVFAVLGQHVPAGMDPTEVRKDLAVLPGVRDVHDLHLWTLTSGMNVATVHLVADDEQQVHSVLDEARELLEKKHGITHATLQVEPEDHKGCAEVGW